MAARTPQIKDILLLMTIPGIGPGRLRRLLSVFGSADTVLGASAKQLRRIDGFDMKMVSHIKAGVDKKSGEQQLAWMAEKNIGCLSIWDEKYPVLLKKTADPPVLLFYKGRIPDQWPNCIGVVGMRMPDHYGRLVTEKLSTQLVENDIAVVSGMARGVDTVAHGAAIQRGGETYAVLGCGVDVVYPAENWQLYENIQQHGAIISEYLIGARPDAVNFPRRNRIISGLSLGSIIVQAGKRSGALITANYALEQNREVFAVPGNINNAKSAGPNRLIQQGAKLVVSIEDVLEEISAKLHNKAPREKPLPPDLDPKETAILAQLSTEPKHIDRLVYDLKDAPASILSRLLMLELKGLVKQLSGKMFIRL